MSNVVDLTSRFKPKPEKKEEIHVELNPDSIEFMINVLTELADTGQCKLNDLSVVFVTLGDMIETLMPTFDKIIEEGKDHD